MIVSMKTGVFAVLCVAGAVASAMPTKDYLAKAQPVVNELMRPLVADFKAKKMDAVAVGDSAIKYADEAVSESAKYLLLRGAIYYYAKGESYDKVVETLETLQGTVKNIPPDTWLEIVSKAADGVKEPDAPALFAIRRQAEIQVNAQSELKKAYSELNRDSNNAAARRQFAEMLAATGKWKRALEEFAKLKGPIARAAKDEQSGQFEAVKLGDIWWDYEPEVKFFAPFAKAHAADFYRQAVAAGKLSGLKGPLVEKRIAEAEAKAKSINVANDAVTAAVEPSPDDPWAIPTKFKTPLERTLKLADGVDMPFCACPPSTFTMSGGKGGSHKVTITRPFWISKTFLTQKQYAAFNPSDEAAAVVGKLEQHFPNSPGFRHWWYWEVSMYINKLNKEFGTSLPNGYVFRLPTEAELDYVERVAMGKTFKPQVFDIEKASAKALAAKGVDLGDWHTGGRKMRLAFDPDAGRTIKNPLGVFSYLIPAGRLLLDSVDTEPNDWLNVKDAAYAEEEVDPVKIGANRMRRVGIGGSEVRKSSSAKWCNVSGYPYIVIGPDLITEKKSGI